MAATFARTTFNSKNYLSYRPFYTQLVYKILYDYHRLPFGTAVDLGCGPVLSVLANVIDLVGYCDRGVE